MPPAAPGERALNRTSMTRPWTESEAVDELAQLLHGSDRVLAAARGDVVLAIGTRKIFTRP
jgi:hypothetical protein